MKSFYKIIVLILVLLTSIKQYGQHHSTMTVELNSENKTLTLGQEITFFNQSNDTLTSIVLNDCNNAYSNKNTPLAKRFSDEFYRGFHLAITGDPKVLVFLASNLYCQRADLNRN